MPNRIMVEIGPNTFAEPIKLTTALSNAVILRYCLAKGISTEGRTQAEIASAFLKSLLRYIRNVSMDTQRIELLAVQQAQIETTLETDNDLFDDPPVPIVAIVNF